ncbi:hypothetical protein P9Z80_13695 [Bacillus cereus]|nr:hypothetical protein [Bacillus cereus]MEC3260904.1 hypothetical protein [Bacillus cereus]
MKSSLAKFMGIAITAVTISVLVFGVAYNMVTSESTSYKGNVEAVKAKLPTK